MERSSLFLTGGLIGMALLLAGCGASVDNEPMSPLSHGPSIVDDRDLGDGWLFGAEKGTGTGEFVIGPDTAPRGAGSASLEVAGAGDAYVLAGAVLQGAKLADIDTMSYHTFRAHPVSGAVTIALQFNINYDPSLNIDNAWQGRLVFEPYYTESITTDEWQEWDTLTQGAWWATGSPGSDVCKQAAPCSWAEVISEFPQAVIRDTGNPSDFPVLFKVGSGWSSGFVGNVDDFRVVVAGETNVFDFEPDKAVCKNGGWRHFSGRRFSNQGDCVGYVASHGAGDGRR